MKFQKANPLYIIQPIPELGFNVPQRILKNSYYNQSKKHQFHMRVIWKDLKTREIISRSAVKCNVKVLDPSIILCKTGQCISEYKVVLFIVMVII